MKTIIASPLSSTMMKQQQQQQSPSSSSSSFVNDDYEYLMKDMDLITTCQEALEENSYNHHHHHHHHHSSSSTLDYQQSELSLSSSSSSCLKLNSLTNCQQQQLHLQMSANNNHCDHHIQQQQQQQSNDFTSMRSPSSAASSGLGLSLEEDFSLKYCQSQQQVIIDEDLVDDDEAEELMMSMKPISTTIHSMADQVINNNSQKQPNGDHHHHESLDSSKMKTIDEPSITITSTSSFQMSMSKTNLCLLPETIGADWSVILARHEAYQNEFEKITHQFFKNINQLTKSGGNNNNTATIGLATINGAGAGDELCSLSSTTSTKTSTTLLRSIKQQKDRCLNLWLKSLEYLTILQKHSGKRCPRHYFVNNKSLLNEINVADRSKPLSSSNIDTKSKQPALNHSYRNILFGHHHNDKNVNIKSPKQTVPPTPPPPPPYNPRHLIVSSFNPSYAAVVASSSSPNSSSVGSIKKVELKSIGTGGSSVIIQNRRVQTSTSITKNQSQMANNMMEQQSKADLSLSLCDTRDSLDGGSGSPGADSGVFSSSMDHSTISSSSSSSSTSAAAATGAAAVAVVKYEIIQKDIGYSSDADMSDAIEAQPHSSDHQSSQQKSSKKRHVRRRRTRTSNRNRPWSYHADWTAWDYYQTPFFCDHFSNEDLNYDDNENIIRKLTEFGENYESWINNELDLTDTDIRDQKPAVVIEKPEIEAFGDEQLQQQPIVNVMVVEKADACTATSPIPFLDKECQVIDELLQMGNNNNDEKDDEIYARSVTKQNKCTETRSKQMIDSSCEPMSCPPSPTPKSSTNKKCKDSKATIPTIKIKPNRSIRKFENNIDDIMARRSPSPLMMKKSSNIIGSSVSTQSTQSTSATITTVCQCGHNCQNNNSSPYSSIKFYTSIALAGLLSFLIAVTQYSPEIHKTYPRPPPL
nr:LOW QUALITY PROTEIN: rho GTPase-activating protein gacF-like [Dermatophagoides farinae]